LYNARFQSLTLNEIYARQDEAKTPSQCLLGLLHPGDLHQVLFVASCVLLCTLFQSFRFRGIFSLSVVRFFYVYVVFPFCFVLVVRFCLFYGLSMSTCAVSVFCINFRIIFQDTLVLI